MSETKQNMDCVELDAKDLPAYCPNPSMPIWSSHPRVFIPLHDQHSRKCPYCGTVYKLKPGTVVRGH